ncbi:hypothetical protein [Aegicerativicinus sediminis]|uniref:hypothetical protein n=1 Tax=Aegicerativicinus sediminis TaxID=2893202 RepID=UPI001E334DED|nr:hypothetical protein [Aegicerativicinus sediminis]
MKRIDDKLQEIEKYHKRNGFLFILSVILIFVCMGLVFIYEKEIRAKDVTISVQSDTISEQKIKLSKTYQELETAYSDLKNSLNPDKYWASIQDQNSVESYLNYITNDLEIAKPYKQDAIKTLDKDPMELEGFEGWVYAGKMNEDIFEDGRMTVLMRNDSTVNLKDVLPKKFDIIKHNKKNPPALFTYKKSKLTSRNPAIQVWRAGSKAFVDSVYQDGIEIRIKVKYY